MCCWYFLPPQLLSVVLHLMSIFSLLRLCGTHILSLHPSLHNIIVLNVVIQWSKRFGKSGNHKLYSHTCFMSMVVLISYQYVCSNNHHCLTTDPRISDVMKSEHIPFILLHKSGFVKSFVRRVIGLISEGMTIAAVERFFFRTT